MLGKNPLWEKTYSDSIENESRDMERRIPGEPNNYKRKRISRVFYDWFCTTQVLSGGASAV